LDDYGPAGLPSAAWGDGRDVVLLEQGACLERARISDIKNGGLTAMSEARNSWLDAAKDALAPGERDTLLNELPGETVVDHLIRIARNSRRAGARTAAVGALFPAARDRISGVVELSLDLLRDPSKAVRYEACRALAVAHVESTLPTLLTALAERVEVPRGGLEGAIRAVRSGRRDAFHAHPDRTFWVLQDEEWDHKAGAARVVGAPAYGTAVR
jgi:hypothetical protein